jgi:hypothetical protein
LDEGGMKDKLQTMKRQANNHEAKLEELIPDLESEGLSSENMNMQRRRRSKRLLK